jgi:hypothetical protein
LLSWRIILNENLFGRLKAKKRGNLERERKEENQHKKEVQDKSI